MRNRNSQIFSRLELVDVPTVSLVGYNLIANAGKSTLFNLIAEARVYAADQLFVTLDPTLRRINVGDMWDTVLADTVGFIHPLPYDLVAAFKATLQEMQWATLLLHIVDAANMRTNENIDAVDQALTEMEANGILMLLVMNKIDLLDDFALSIDRDEKN